MKRILAILIILMAWQSPAWGANYYVATTGSNTSPYDTWAKAATSITTILGLSLEGTNIIYLADGTYTSTINLNAAKYANLSFIGTSRDGIILNHSDTGSNSIYVSSADVENVTFQNLTVISKGTTGTTKVGAYDFDYNGLWYGHRGAPIGAYSQGVPRSRNTATIK